MEHLYPELRTVGHYHLLQSVVFLTYVRGAVFCPTFFKGTYKTSFRTECSFHFKISRCDIRIRLAKRRKKSTMTDVQLALLVKLHRDYRQS